MKELEERTNEPRQNLSEWTVLGVFTACILTCLLTTFICYNLTINSKENKLDIGDAIEMLKDSGLDLNNVTEVLGMAKAFAPMLEMVVDALFEFSPALTKLFDTIGDYSTQRYITTFNKLIEGGFHREEAMQILITSNLTLASIIRELNSK